LSIYCKQKKIFLLNIIKFFISFFDIIFIKNLICQKIAKFSVWYIFVEQKKALEIIKKYLKIFGK